MATLIENALSMESAKANIKNAIEEKGQDLTNVPFTEYASKIKEIESGGGSSDLIDVTELPTTDVQDDKVYRTTNSTGTYCVSLVVTSQDQTAIISFESMLKMMNITLPPMNEIIVEDINDVTEPILSGESFVVYTDKSTGIGYVFGDLEGTGNVERLTLAEFFNMFNSLTGELYPMLSDKGAIDDASEITEDGIYYLQNVSIKTIIGVPNTNNNKQVYEYNGIEWNEYSSLTTDNLVGLWRDVRLSGSADLYFQEFKADGTIVYKNQYGDTFGLPTEYTIRDGLVFTIDLDGVSTNYKYIVRDGLPTLNNADTDELILEKATELNTNNLVDVATLPLFANDDKVYRVINETETQIGVPNANNDKKILQYNGTEWTEVGTGGATKQFEFRFPDGVTLTSQVFSYIYDEQYTVYSSDNHTNGRTWLFDKTTDERFEIFPYGSVAYFAKCGDFVCGGGKERNYHSFIYNVKTKTLVKTYNYGYSNIQTLYNDVLFSETGNGYQYYNFSTGGSLDASFNLPISVKMFRVSDKKFITIYNSKIYVCDISNTKSELISLPSDIPVSSNTRSHSIEMLDENMALVAGGTFVGILDVNTNEFIQYMSGSNMSPTCSQLQHIKRVGPYYLCVNYEYSAGKIIKVDFDNNEYSILMDSIQYPKVILTHTDWENAVVLANGKMFFFDSSDESITQISTNSTSTLDYFEQVNEINLLFITGSHAHCVNITDGSDTYKNVGNSRTVVKGTDKYLIVPTSPNGSGYIFVTSSDLSDFTQINTGVQVITTVKQKGDQYNVYTRNFDDKNRDTITEYVFSTGKDQLVMVTAKNIDEMFQ